MTANREHMVLSRNLNWRGASVFFFPFKERGWSTWWNTKTHTCDWNFSGFCPHTSWENMGGESEEAARSVLDNIPRAPLGQWTLFPYIALVELLQRPAASDDKWSCVNTSMKEKSKRLAKTRLEKSKRQNPELVRSSSIRETHFCLTVWPRRCCNITKSTKPKSPLEWI